MVFVVSCHRLRALVQKTLEVDPHVLGGLAGTPIAILLFEDSNVEDDGLSCCDELVFGFDLAGEVCVE